MCSDRGYTNSHKEGCMYIWSMKGVKYIGPRNNKELLELFFEKGRLDFWGKKLTKKYPSH